MRTTDTDYSQDYWDSLDDGAGYQDSTMWEDLAFITKEVLIVDPQRGDISSEVNLLDLGCAYGFLVRHLRRRGVEAWGADVSRYALGQAPDDVTDYVHHYDLVGPSDPGVIPGYPFKRLTCFETLEHIDENLVPLALTRIRDALVPGGVALLTICTSSRHGWDTDPTHVTIKPRQWWVDLLRRVHFPRLLMAEERLSDFHLFRHHDGVFVVTRGS